MQVVKNLEASRAACPILDDDQIEAYLHADMCRLGLRTSKCLLQRSCASGASGCARITACTTLPPFF